MGRAKCGCGRLAKVTLTGKITTKQGQVLLTNGKYCLRCIALASVSRNYAMWQRLQELFDTIESEKEQ